MTENTIQQFWKRFHHDLQNFINSHKLTRQNSYVMRYAYPNNKMDSFHWSILDNRWISIDELYFAYHEFIHIKQHSTISTYINQAVDQLMNNEISTETIKCVLTDSEAIVERILNHHFEFPYPDAASSKPFADNNKLYDEFIGLGYTPVKLLRLMRNRIHPERNEGITPISENDGDKFEMLRFIIFTFISMVALCRKCIVRYKHNAMPDALMVKMEGYIPEKSDRVLNKFQLPGVTVNLYLQKQTFDVVSTRWTVRDRSGKSDKKQITIQNVRNYEDIVLTVTLNNDDNTTKNIKITTGAQKGSANYIVRYEDEAYKKVDQLPSSDESRTDHNVAGIHECNLRLVDEFNQSYEELHNGCLVRYYLSYAVARGNYVCCFWDLEVIPENDTIDLSFIVPRPQEFVFLRETKDNIFYVDDVPLSVPGKVNYIDRVRHISLCGNCKDIVTLKAEGIDAETISLGWRQFGSKLERIYIGKGCEIGDCAFTSCYGLQSVYVNEDCDYYLIGKEAFKNCWELRQISITSVPGDEAFAECWKLDTVNFRKGSRSITRIGKGTFSGCKSLHGIDLPEELEEIGEDAFRNSGLRKIALPASLIRIGKAAFAECRQLEQISFPDGFNVKEIHTQAFKGAWNLNCINIGSETYDIAEFIEKYKASIVENDIFDTPDHFSSLKSNLRKLLSTSYKKDKTGIKR